MKLLVIRPQPAADATAARIEAAGHDALLMPLFAVEPVAWEAPSAEDFDGLLLTSANAVRQAGPQLSALASQPVFAVGKVTSAAARHAGMNVKQTGEAGVMELLRNVRDCKLLWLAGEDHTEFNALASVHIETRIVYRSASLPLPTDFSENVMQADHVLLHSARAAEYFASSVARQGLDKAGISIAALSRNIADNAGTGWKSVHVASQPTDAALLSCL